MRCCRQCYKHRDYYEIGGLYGLPSVPSSTREYVLATQGHQLILRLRWFLMHASGRALITSKTPQPDVSIMQAMAK
jgi:hypothetical protein